MIAELVALAISGPLDRLRGDARHILGARILDKIALGVCMAVLAGYPHPTLWAALIVAAMIAGMSPGWGAPMGAALGGRSSMPQDDLEWWQVGVLARSVPLALVARGAIWGAPVAALAPIVGDPVLLWFLPAYAVAMPASIYVVRGLEVRDTWAAAEWVRGYMAAAIVLVGRVTMP